MMKRMWICLCFALMMLAGTALAVNDSDLSTPRAGMAFCAPKDREETVEMFESPDEGSRVLMHYFSGTRMEVVEVLEGGMVKAYTGIPSARLTGYMRADDLLYGPNGQRAGAHRTLMAVLAKPAVVRALPEDGAEELDRISADETVQIVGHNEDGWQQLEGYAWQENVMQMGGWMHASAWMDGGFIRLDVDSLASEGANDDDWDVFAPCADELTHEEAYERAIAVILSGEHDPNGYFGKLPERFQSEEGLRSMRADVRLCGRRDSLQWFIVLEDEENIDYNLCVTLTPKGDAAEEISRGNG